MNMQEKLQQLLEEIKKYHLDEKLQKMYLVMRTKHDFTKYDALRKLKDYKKDLIIDDIDKTKKTTKDNQKETLKITTTIEPELTFLQKIKKQAYKSFIFIKNNFNIIAFIFNIIFIIYRFFKPNKSASEELLQVVNARNEKLAQINEETIQKMLVLNVKHQKVTNNNASYFSKLKNALIKLFLFTKEKYSINPKATIAIITITALLILFVIYKSYQKIKKVFKKTKLD